MSDLVPADATPDELATWQARRDGRHIDRWLPPSHRSDDARARARRQLEEQGLLVGGGGSQFPLNDEPATDADSEVPLPW